MTDEECTIVESFLAAPSSHGGRPPANKRRVVDAILWAGRTGAPWRDLPEAFGNWNSVWPQFRRRREAGVWDLLLQDLADGCNESDALRMIDSTTIPTHCCTAGEKADSKSRRLAALAAASPPRAISVAMG
jgi:transposase